MTYMETIFISVISLIGIGIGLTLIFNAFFLPLISLFSSEIAIFFLDIFLIRFLLIFIFLIIKYSTYWSFWGATLIYQGMTGFDTLKKNRQIVSGNFGQIFSYNAIILLISLILKSTSIGLLILTGNLIPFYIIIFALTFINLFFIVFYSVYFLSFEIWHAQRTMRHDLKLTADGEHKG